MSTYQALYLHIPFCSQRCAYCDFTTEALPATSPQLDTYLERLIRELRAASRQGELACLQTVYLGGGTPTHFGHGRLVELAYTLSLSLKLEQVHEYTLEANPESYTAALGRDLYALGVNRLSFGVQSFVDTELAVLGRAHTAQQARRAVCSARERYKNLSLDLMCGIPGQTLASWEYSLMSALELDPAHLSVYPLELYEDTPLGQRFAHGLLANPSEDDTAASMELAAELLTAAGYTRYEVASYAKPGYRCAHNEAYWTGLPYLGLGRGAASMKNLPNKARERWLIAQDDTREEEHLTSAQACLEDLMLGMRLARGVTEELVAQAVEAVPALANALSALKNEGFVEHAGGRWYPTQQRGWLLANELYGRIWQLAT